MGALHKMREEIEMIPVKRENREGHRQQIQRRRMNAEAYREIQRRKRKRAARRKKLRRLTVLVMLMLVAAFIGINSQEWFATSLVQTDGDTLQYPEFLLEALEKNPELEEFVKGYNDADGSVTGGISEAELAQDIPLLMQYDSRWGYVAFGDDNIALSGCAPTCLSMVITALKKTADAPPDVVAEFCVEQGYYQKGVGTDWSLMTEGCLEFGVCGQELGLDKDVIFSRLEAGDPIICSMRPGDFTTTGHFIVLVGVEDGKLRVNDPFSKERSNKLWDFERIQYQIKNLWVFTAL